MLPTAAKQLEVPAAAPEGDPADFFSPGLLALPRSGPWADPTVDLPWRSGIYTIGVSEPRIGGFTLWILPGVGADLEVLTAPIAGFVRTSR